MRTNLPTQLVPKPSWPLGPTPSPHVLCDSPVTLAVSVQSTKTQPFPQLCLTEDQPAGRLLASVLHTATYVPSSAPSGFYCFQHRAGRCGLGGLLLQPSPLPLACPSHTGLPTPTAPLKLTSLFPILLAALMGIPVSLPAESTHLPQVGPQGAPPLLPHPPSPLPAHPCTRPADEPAGRSRG